MTINSQKRFSVFIITICFLFVTMNMDAQTSEKKSEHKQQKTPSHYYQNVSLKADLEVKIIPLYRRFFRSKTTSYKKSGFKPGTSLYGKFRIKVTNIGSKSTRGFYVDLVLSSDKYIPIKYASYSPTFHEDVLLFGGRIRVRGLKPGKHTNLRIPRRCKLPERIKAGTYFLGAVVDPNNLVAEANVKNNISMTRIRIEQLLYQPISINSIKQTGVWPSASGHFEMTLNGTGFGNTIGTRTVRVGTHSFGANNMEYWSQNQVIVWFPYDFPLGNIYNIWIEEGGIRISNLKQNVMLYMDLSGTEFADGNGNPIPPEAQANTIITMQGLFGPTQGSNVVKFGNMNAQVISWNNYRIKITVPNLPPAQYSVFIERNNIRVSFEAKFTILP